MQRFFHAFVPMTKPHINAIRNIILTDRKVGLMSTITTNEGQMSLHVIVLHRCTNSAVKHPRNFDQLSACTCAAAASALKYVSV